ncbi:PAS domain S-box protein [Funiculus sociatus GB2-A5]|uniref:histidine kinase n=1 Tax=Funiculus sociatus GB2-A5 TaxID=2933946 RepID=A0ABV0JN66_9CYAN|nr:PAS domain S-box protein [Trichocoleus sp. FACHB-6]MBD2064941.1 PAS domain S-box protein [Trichocoleus sp. FACHB-6]
MASRLGTGNAYATSLRSRLLLLVLLAVIPAFGLTLYTHLEDRHLETVEAKENALRLNRLATDNQERLIENTRQLLTVLAQLPEVRQQDAKLCSEFLASLRQEYPNYGNLGVVEADGDVFCSALPFKKPINLGNRLWFVRTFKERNFATGDYQIGQITGRPGLVFSYPLLDEKRQVTGVVYAALDLRSLSQLVNTSHLPPGSTFTLIDSNGTILARYPNPEKWIGQSAPEVPLVKTILKTQKTGTVESVGLDGISRLYAFAPLSGVCNNTSDRCSIYVTIGIPKTVAYAEAEGRLKRNLFTLGSIAVFVVIATWIGSDVFILRRVKALMKATHRLSKGDLSVRTGLAYGRGEFNQLAYAFDTMAASLESSFKERESAEAALRKSEKKYRSLVNSLPQVLFQTDEAGHWTFLNPAWTQLTGFTIEESIGKNFLDYIHPEERDRNLQEFFALISQQKEYFHNQGRYITKDGRHCYLEVTAQLTLASDGRINGTSGSLTDITERQIAESALRESEERWHLALRGNNDGIWDWNIKTNQVFLSARWKEMLGYEDDEIANHFDEWIGRVHPDDVDWVRQLCQDHLDKKIPFYVAESRLRCKDGTYKWILNRGQALWDETGNPVRMTGSHTDISDRKLGEAALAASEAKFRSLIQNSSDIITIIDADGVMQYQSPSVEIILGYKSEELIGKRYFDFVDPEKINYVKNNLSNLIENSDLAVSIEYRYQHKNGYWRYLSSRCTNLFADPAVGGIVVNSRDITGRKTAEEALRQSEERFRNIVENTNDWVWEKDINNAYTYVNPKVKDILGYEPDEILGKRLFEFMTPSEAERFAQLMDYFTSLRQPFSQLEKTLLHKDGHEVILGTSGSPVFDHQGVFQGYRGIARDITLAKQAEALIAGQKRLLEMIATGVPLLQVLDALVQFIEEQSGEGISAILLVDKTGTKLLNGAAPSLPGSYTQAINGIAIAPNVGCCGSAAYFGKPVIVSDIENDPLWTEFRDLALSNGLRSCWSMPIFSTNGKILGTFAMYYRKVRPPSAEDLQLIAVATQMAGIAIERQQSLEALQESEARFRRLAESNMFGVFFGDINGNIAEANNAFLSMVGYTREDLLAGRVHWDALIPLECRSLNERAIAEIRKSGSCTPFEQEYTRKDGSCVPILFGMALLDEYTDRVGCFAVDLTERRQLEKALAELLVLEQQARTEAQASEQRYRLLADAMPQIVWTGQPDGFLDYYNQRWFDYTGMTLEQTQGWGWQPILHPDDVQNCLDTWNHAVQTGEPYKVEYRFKRASDGKYRWHLGWALPLRDRNGNIIKWFGTSTDIDDQKRAEEGLRQSEERYRSLARATTQIVWTTNGQGEMITEQADWTAYTGQSEAEIQGWGWLEAVHPDERDRASQEWSQAIQTKSIYNTEFRLRGADGDYRYFNVRGVPLLSEEGEIREWIGTCTDITEKVLSQEAIRQLNAELEKRVIERTAQLEAANKELEAFCYSVSHDLRSPLRAINGFSRILQEDYSDQLDPEAQRYQQMVQDNAQKMGELIDDLLSFSRLSRQPLRKQPVAILHLVRQVLAELQEEQQNRNIGITIGELPICQGDPALLKQVFINLLSNAFKFTRDREIAQIEIGYNDQSLTNTQELITNDVYFIKDNGAGFDMRYAHKLFGVFQRLHRADEYEGTGVGLAIVQRIIHRHGGRIWAESAVNQGTIFYFTLTGANGHN